MEALRLITKDELIKEQESIDFEEWTKDLYKRRHAKEWMFEAMKMMQCGLRDISQICGAKNSVEFYQFINSFKRQGRLFVTTESFFNKRKAIEKALKKYYDKNIKPKGQQ